MNAAEDRFQHLLGDHAVPPDSLMGRVIFSWGVQFAMDQLNLGVDDPRHRALRDILFTFTSESMARDRVEGAAK